MSDGAGSSGCVLGLSSCARLDGRGGRPYVFIVKAVPTYFILILFLHSVPFAKHYTFDQS
jgi:hypothetical protein